MIVEYTPKAVADAHTAVVSSPREPWFYAVARDLKLKPIRNRDRPKIAFAKGFRKPR